MALNTTDWSLLERVVHGDEQAYAEFRRIYGPYIQRTFRTCGVAKYAIDDLTEQVLSNLLHYVLHLAHQAPAGKPWSRAGVFRQIVNRQIRNRRIDQLRRRRKAAVGGTDHQDRLDQVPEEAASREDVELSQSVWLILNHLPADVLDRFRHTATDNQFRVVSAVFFSPAGEVDDSAARPVDPQPHPEFRLQLCSQLQIRECDFERSLNTGIACLAKILRESQRLEEVPDEHERWETFDSLYGAIARTSQQEIPGRVERDALDELWCELQDFGQDPLISFAGLLEAVRVGRPAEPRNESAAPPAGAGEDRDSRQTANRVAAWIRKGGLRRFLTSLGQRGREVFERRVLDRQSPQEVLSSLELRTDLLQTIDQVNRRKLILSVNEVAAAH